MESVLLEKSSLPFGAFDFSRLKLEEFIPSLKKAIETANKELEDYRKTTENTFDSVIERLERIDEDIDHIASVFYALYSAHAPAEMQKISQEFSEMLNKYSNNVSMDSDIFARIKKLYEEQESLKISDEQKVVLDKYFKSFVRNGALLSDDDKEKLKEININLSKYSLEFADAVLADSNNFLKVVEQEKQLEGIPDGAIEAAAQLANEKGYEGKWAFSLQFPSFLPVAQYAKDESLRKEMYLAFVNRAVEGEDSNKERILEITKLRHERAKLLGFKNHAEFVLKERMAQSPEKVYSFLDELYEKSYRVAKADMEQLKSLKQERGEGDKLEPWDVNYYSTLLKKKLFSMDDELLKPYFKLENVISGVFKVASNLYGLDFIENKEIPVYHEEVKTYEVHDKKSGEFIGLFYADFFPRDTKKSGAWMTDLKEQGLRKGKVDRPHISIVCNFTRPTKTKPSLLTLNEVTTLFHEFGHALHGLLSRCTYRSVSGTSVYWDFVELPSQLLENWVYEKECLDLFATHYETGEAIPEEYVNKIKAMGKFMQGYMTIRQLTFAYLDMAWHSTAPDEISSVKEFEKNAIKKCQLLENSYGLISCAFSHIFAGGYSAGYYSYKWAEVLDADAFEHFSEMGIFNDEVASKFREFILEKGGSEHPMDLYRQFRGRGPSVDALLKRSGLDKQ